ncbi:MAG: hypothetical protein ACTSO7_16975 [Candidatus Heimdallarchaeota archaeon]
MKKSIKALLIVLTILMLFGGTIIGMLIYGTAARNYEILAPTDTINSRQVSDFVEDYKPIIYQNNSYAFSPTKLFYEVVSQPDYYVVIYRVVWVDELHPNGFIHALYRAYRAVTYGSVQDIEFVEYLVNKTTYHVDEVRFETLGGESTFMPDHETIVLSNNSGIYNYLGDDGLTEDLSYNPFNGTRLRLTICSWNHLFNVSNTISGTSYSLTLELLNDEDYKSFKMSARSAGIISSKRSGAIMIPISFAILFAAIPIPSYYLITFYQKKRSR